MRLALALFIVALAAAPTAAQQARPGQPPPSNQPSPSSQATPAAKPNQAEEVLRQRILLREKFNKGWQVQDEDPRQKRARCKSEARKQFTAMHPLKRRKFQKECMAKAGR
jgi:hypothetical protein